MKLMAQIDVERAQLQAKREAERTEQLERHHKEMVKAVFRVKSRGLTEESISMLMLQK